MNSAFNQDPVLHHVQSIPGGAGVERHQSSPVEKSGTQPPQRSLSALTPAVGTSAEAIDYHYSISNGFYRLWLDDELNYSCAMWEPGDTLEQAQVRKLDHHLNAIGVEPGSRVLDIGCGWGSTLKRMSQVKHVRKAVGLTLSSAQAQWIQSLKIPNVEVSLQSWNDHIPDQPYSGITAIGVLEHSVKPFLKPDEKIKAYRNFFRRCHRMLEPEGRMSAQTIVLLSPPRTIAQIEESRFIAEEIFPESDLPKIQDITKAIDGLFELILMRNDRLDYEKTCEQWLRNLQKNRQEAVIVSGETVVKRYERYLESCMMLFSQGVSGLLRFSLRKLSRSHL